MSGPGLAAGTADLTEQLTRVSARTPPVEATDAGLDAALHARSAVLALARQVTAAMRVTPLTRPPVISDLYAQPSAAMAWALARHQAMPARSSPIDVARGAIPGSTTSLWEHAAATATRLHASFERANAQGLALESGKDLRANPARAPLVADIAVLVGVVTRHEPALADLAHHLGDDAVAETLLAASRSPLRGAAEATWRSTDLSRSWELDVPEYPRRLGVLRVRDAASLPLGLARLATLLRAGPALSPQQTALLLTACARMTRAVAAHAPVDRPREAPPLIAVDAASAGRRWRDGLSPLQTQPGPVLTRAGLTHYARRFAEAWSPRDGALAALEPSDPRPVHQAGECVRALATAPREAGGGSAWSTRLLTATTTALDDVLVAACATVDAQLARGAWLTRAPREDSDDLAARWRPLERAERPHVAVALHDLRLARGRRPEDGPRSRLVVARAALASEASVVVTARSQPSPVRASLPAAAPARAR